jgi:two-component system sensor histidine kinase CpxA
MMKIVSSLFTKILIWFFLNLALVALVLGVFFSLESQVRLQSIFGRQSENRMRIAGRLIANELEKAPQKEWNDVLARFAQIYQVDFVVLIRNGQVFSSTQIPIPQKLALDISRINHRPDRFRPHQGMMPHHGRSMPHPPEKHFMKHTRHPSRYWSGIRIWIPYRPDVHMRPAILLAVSDSITGNGFFFDPTPWIVAVLIVIALSVLFWIPMIRHITQPLKRMTRAAEEIAKGKFDGVITEDRADEIGRLAKAINHMTSRLGGYVRGQKRFLGDVAHELCSPIARIQLGLGILENRIDAQHKDGMADVVEDVTHMSNLVNELLSFTRAEIDPGKVTLERTPLLPIVTRVLEREKAEHMAFVTRIDPDTKVVADAELLARAMSNLVRNAIRYAGQSGPIHIIAEQRTAEVTIEVRDQGPGVPEELIDHLFEPFYRVEPSRDRDSGGVGLGLAIVKTCVETCKGTVTARNLKPIGFTVLMTLNA